ncbi:PD-(D/E)XK nuclease family protein [Luteolibacter ambystomatis]|uniref:PD-(D/E)XK nuclease family protein n=1 Tax=Luteolibacter ambystomatis TaxID=2824561 RepID=A0A975G871_9BACT|nr:PD-(D/E)XK nuclease family protein [Luteolibacter ambystomatis]QUE51139.1 PD-(D/E)XK nuclease family protein [Luteolibacter ambystomatis]
MVEREFLGWDRPFLGLLVAWLLARRDALPGMLVVVPTAQSGRRLREALAEAGAGLAPRVVTPGHFMRTESAAPAAIEHLAWVEVLENIPDWHAFEEVFPIPPGEGEAAGWALGLAGAMTNLRMGLQEGAITLAVAAKRMVKSIEAGRWQALAVLEERVEKRLALWGFTSRSALLARAEFPLLEGAREIVLAGLPDVPAAVATLLLKSPVPVTALVGAPPDEDMAFDELGRPKALKWEEDPETKKPTEANDDIWTGRTYDWPSSNCGSVTLTADPRQQAAEAVRMAAQAGAPSDDLVVGSADEETAGELVRAFGRAGWVLHDPSHLPPQPVMAWLAAWSSFVKTPTLATAIDLLGFSQTGVFVSGRRAQRAKALSAARDKWLAKERADLVRSLELATRGQDQESLRLAIETMEALEKRRGLFQRDGFHAGLEKLMKAIDPKREETSELHDWLEATAGMAERVDRDPGFWIDLLLASGPEAMAVPPDDRVLDVQGWLELFHEPGRHLIICGMNEGKVPGRASSDAWLPENIRKLLGLSTDHTRATRDAYLLTAMTHARRGGGRVDLLLAKSGAGGDSLLPSRLLLVAEEKDLPGRVTALFREIEPPDAGLAWTLEEAWKWRPRTVEMKPRLGVTAFSDYLACPFRFYLKHVVGMSAPEPERVEWNARDFGNIAHTVLENWARDEEAKDYSKTEAIEAWVHAELDRIVIEHFGTRPPLAVRIQKESLRQRLSWFAKVQACERALGWRIVEVEQKFEIPIDDFTIVGRIDRIERHEDGRRRVLDYKTGNVGPIESAHRVAMTTRTVLPAHLENVPAIIHTAPDGKMKRWKNLQLAMYAAALGDVDEIGYFALGAVEGDVGLSLWDGFSADDRDSAMACAQWVVGQLKEGVFHPPAEKVPWDDYQVLTFGRSLVETVAWEGGAE